MVSALVTPPAQKGRLALPDRLVVCPWGESRDLAGNPVIVNDVTVATLSARQSEFGFDEVALDFDHNTAPRVDAEGKVIPLEEPQKIAAMGRLSVEAGVGIVFTPTSWTPEGEEHYTGRHYRDLSPTVGKTDKGEVNFIHSVALTRKGQIPNLHAFSFASIGNLPALSALSVPITAPAPDSSETTPATSMDLKALLCKLLKLPETATDEEIVAAGDAAMSALSAPEAAATAAAAPSTTAMAAAGAPTVVSLAAEFDAFRRDQLIQQASVAGKVIPLDAEQIKTVPLATLSALIEKLPATVPLNRATPAGGKEEPEVKTLSAAAKDIADKLGLTDKQREKMAITNA